MVVALRPAPKPALTFPQVSSRNRRSMFNLHRCKTKLQGSIFTTTSPCSICFPHFQLFRLPISLEFSSTPSDSNSFRVSYLVNNCGFSKEAALKASKILYFQTSEKPDSFLNFLRRHGFSNSQIHSIVSKAPKLLSCDSDKRVLPKFEFFLSKGLSTSDIVLMVTRCPYILLRSLQDRIIPSYGIVKRLFQSDEKTITCIKGYPGLLHDSRLNINVELLRDSGVADSNIARFLCMWPRMFCSSVMGKAVEEVKQLGFDPSKTNFGLAVFVKATMGKSLWDEKVDTYKKWGWTEDAILKAYRMDPYCMLRSTDKIDVVLSYWVNQLGWDSLAIVKGPAILGLSLKKSIIPRASVLQFLLSKGLMKKNASLITPFKMSERDFFFKFVLCFEEETSSQLLNLYKEKINVQDNREKGGI